MSVKRVNAGAKKTHRASRDGLEDVAVRCTAGQTAAAAD